jgi:arylsulfatase A-like enzyme
MIRRGDWKLTYYGPKKDYAPGFQLFNLREDPEERNNLYLQNPPQLASLKEALANWNAQNRPHVKNAQLIG